RTPDRHRHGHAGFWIDWADGGTTRETGPNTQLQRDSNGNGRIQLSCGFGLHGSAGAGYLHSHVAGYAASGSAFDDSGTSVHDHDSASCSATGNSNSNRAAAAGCALGSGADAAVFSGMGPPATLAPG